MKTIVLAAAALLITTNAAQADKTYQITGQVIDLDKGKITIKKNKRGSWTMARTQTTDLPPDVKPGDIVTIHYTMTAVDVVQKPTPKKTAPKH